MSLLGFLFPTSGFFAGLLTLLSKALDFAHPLWVMCLDFVKWYFKTFWLGLSQLFHNLAILTVIAPLLLFSMGYVSFKEEQECKQELTTIREEYMFVKRDKKKLIKLDTKKEQWNPIKGAWEVITETTKVFK